MEMDEKVYNFIKQYMRKRARGILSGLVENTLKSREDYEDLAHDFIVDIYYKQKDKFRRILQGQGQGALEKYLKTSINNFLKEKKQKALPYSSTLHRNLISILKDLKDKNAVRVSGSRFIPSRLTQECGHPFLDENDIFSILKDFDFSKIVRIATDGAKINRENLKVLVQQFCNVANGWISIHGLHEALRYKTPLFQDLKAKLLQRPAADKDDESHGQMEIFSGESDHLLGLKMLDAWEILTERQKRIIELKCKNDYTNQEIADILGTENKNWSCTHSTISREWKKIRKIFCKNR